MFQKRSKEHTPKLSNSSERDQDKHDIPKVATEHQVILFFTINLIFLKYKDDSAFSCSLFFPGNSDPKYQVAPRKPRELQCPRGGCQSPSWVKIVPVSEGCPVRGVGVQVE